MTGLVEWKALSPKTLSVMKELGNFRPTVNAQYREVKGYMLDDDGVGKCYWTSDDLRNIATACVEVAEWLDKRADSSAAALRGEG